MIYYEKLGLRNVLSLFLTKRRAFYGTKSIAARLVEKLDIKANVTKIDFGDLQIAPDVRKNAYLTAELQLAKINANEWAKELSGSLSIDFDLIVKRFFHDELYAKYEFIELALRYALENPNESHEIHVDEQFVEPYEDRLRESFRVRRVRRVEPLYLFTIFFLPALLAYFSRKHGKAHRKSFERQMICEVTGAVTYEMFSAIFQSYPAKHFIMDRKYAGEFGDNRLSELGITVLGLSKEDYLYLRDAVYKYIFSCLRHFKELSRYGSRLFMLFYALIVGRSITIQGTGNLCFTYGHLELAKAVRNEFLRAGGNRSIYVSMNAGVTPRYYAEILPNYDIICVAGKHEEDTYTVKHAVTDIFLPAGAYQSHRGSVSLQGKAERIARLRSFKANSVAVTILSPGICDPTYRREVKMMQLARELAEGQDIKIFIKPKPVPPIPKYADFYDIHTAGCDSIMVASFEYELADFLEVTDLFVTSISNSGFDAALSGGQVMFIDFMKEPDFSLVWSVVKEVVLPEEESFSAIMDWVKDGGLGAHRARLEQNMRKLNGYLGYRFPDFESYRTNLLTQLRIACRNHPALAATERQQFTAC